MKNKKFIKNNFFKVAAFIFVLSFMFTSKAEALTNDNSILVNTSPGGGTSYISVPQGTPYIYMSGNFKTESWIPSCGGYGYRVGDYGPYGLFSRAIDSIRYDWNSNANGSLLVSGRSFNNGSDYSWVSGPNNAGIFCYNFDGQQYGSGQHSDFTDRVYHFNNVQIPIPGSLAPGIYELSLTSTETPTDIGSCDYNLWDAPIYDYLGGTNCNSFQSNGQYDILVTITSSGGTCTDSSAQNYGGPLPCVPQGGGQCTDTNADNYGAPLPCTYPPQGGAPTVTPVVPACSNTDYTVELVPHNNGGWGVSWMYVADNAAMIQYYSAATAGQWWSPPRTQLFPDPATNWMFYGSAPFTLHPNQTYWARVYSDSGESTPVAWNVPNCLPTVNAVTISSPNVVTGPSHQYTITNAASEPTGYGNLIFMMALINLQGADSDKNRGYLMWGTGVFYPGQQEQQTCAGGGYAWIYATSPFYGNTYTHLDSCSVTGSGNTRTVSFLVHFDPTFTTPTTGNDISGYAYNNYWYGPSTGWVNFADLFNIVPDVPGPDLKISNALYPTVNNSDGPIGTYYGSPYTLSWAAVPNAVSCSLDGGAQNASYANGGTSNGTALALTTTHTLTCLNSSSQSASDTVIVTTPPPPTNVSVTCPAPGTTINFTWTAPGGWNNFYTRITGVSHDTVMGTSDSFTGLTPGNTYSYWMHTRNPTNQAWSDQRPAPSGSVTCNAGASGTISGTACSIASGASTCNSTVNWTTSNFSSTPAVVGSNPVVTISNAAAGPVSTPINFGSSTFTLKNGAAVVQTSAAVNATCASPSTWSAGLGKCIENGACGTTNNSCTAGQWADVADNSTTYFWNCNGRYGGTNAPLCSAAIPPGGPISASDPILAPDQCTTLSWGPCPSGTTSATLNGVDTGGVFSGSPAICPTNTTQYCLSCKTPTGVSTNCTTVTVKKLPYFGEN